MSVTRRLFVQGTAAWATVAATAHALALGKRSAFRIGHLQLGASWNPRPTALSRLLRELDKRTAIAVELDPQVLRLGDQALVQTPFLYLAGDREFAMPAPNDVLRLRRYLAVGGFLLIDSAEGDPSGAFDGAVRQLLELVYPEPGTGLAIVRPDHVVFRSFYLIDRPFGRLAVSPTLDGVEQDGRLQVAYVGNDLGGALARDDFGNWKYQCHPDGERQREMAFRTAVNLVMYALCLDYKEDQTHVDFVLQKRRWKPMDGAEAPSK